MPGNTLKLYGKVPKLWEPCKK